MMTRRLGDRFEWRAGIWLAALLILFSINCYAQHNSQASILIAEASWTIDEAELGLATPFASAVCDLYRGLRKEVRDCIPQRIAAAWENWPRLLYDGGVEIAIVEQSALDRAWDATSASPETPSSGLRYVLRTTNGRVLVSSSAVSSEIIREAVRIIIANRSRLQVLSTEAAGLMFGPAEAKRLETTRRPPLHPGAWQAFFEEGWLASEPVWTVVGSFRKSADGGGLRDAVSAAEFLLKRVTSLTNADLYGVDSEGFQIRLGANGFYGLIAGAATNRRRAQAKIAALREAISEIPADAFPFPAVRGWGPDLLYLRPFQAE
jgi:hypothetical protein